MRIYLTGFMGSGKSYVAHHIADQVDIPVLDLDTMIEEKEGSTINQIFEDKGEPYFRQLEQTCLKETIQHQTCIIATGGGTPCYFDNMNFINQNGMSIYLEVDTTILVNRLLENGDVRPLLKGMNATQLKDFIDQKVNERRAFYEQAHLVYHYKSASQNIVKELVFYLKSIYNL